MKRNCKNSMGFKSNALACKSVINPLTPERIMKVRPNETSPIVALIKANWPIVEFPSAEDTMGMIISQGVL